MNDRWNPRIWLRNWLSKPSNSELAETSAAEAAAEQLLNR